jgi:hypothetical protein
MRGKLLAFVGLLLFWSGSAWADEVANLVADGTIFRAASGAAYAILVEGAAFFSVFIDGKKRYRSDGPNPHLKLGTLFVSDDGLTVTWMLADHFYGQPAPEEMKDWPALIFYREGKEIRRYSLAELLVRKDQVCWSTSHTEWIVERRNPDWSPAGMSFSFSPDGSRFELETTSFRRYLFEPRTGKMLLAEDTELFREADLIVYGEVTAGVEKGRIAIREPFLIKGSVPAKETLTCLDPAGYFPSGRWGVVVLNKKGTDWVVQEPPWRVPVSYNILSRRETAD